MILWTAVLALTLGVVGSGFLLQPPSSVVAQIGKPKAQPAVLNLMRAPASATQPPHASVMPLDENNRAQAVDLTISCDGEPKTVFSGTVTQVRLSGRLCKFKEVASSSIVNTNNRFSATVFIKDDSSYTTDYIALVPGENKIQISHQFKSGDREDSVYLLIRQKE